MDKEQLRELVAPYCHGTLGEERFNTYYDVSKDCDVEGAFVECGVCNGGTLGILTANAGDRHVWGP